MVIGAIFLIFIGICVAVHFLVVMGGIILIVDYAIMTINENRRSNFLPPMPIDPTLHVWNDDVPHADQKFLKLKKIVVETEEDKRQLLLASEYIHDFREIDTDIMAVNFIAHLYLEPQLIEVENYNGQEEATPTAAQ